MGEWKAGCVKVQLPVPGLECELTRELSVGEDLSQATLLPSPSIGNSFIVSHQMTYVSEWPAWGQIWA